MTKRLQRTLLLALALTLACAAKAQQAKEIILLHTSDTHSRIEPITQTGDTYYHQGGFVRRATFIDSFRKEHANVLLFDCGDISQGTPYYNLFKGELEIEYMNLMRYDAMAIGNHEFDYGMDNMARIFRMAHFPIVCANYNLDATPLKGLTKPYVVIQRFGLKIGVFGLSPDPAGLIQATKCEGVVYEDPIEAAQRAATLLKREGCDLVICLSHLGIQMDERLIGMTRHIDVVLGGHSHTFMKAPKTCLNSAGQKVPLMHTGKNGVFVGEMEIKLETEN
ncbi:MAG: metallophosphatase [Mediterranea sp.]|jgi:5'-nucleotidase|nr:metallophosphatase [Mediterranea sp.]